MRAQLDPLAAQIMQQIASITARRDKLTDGYLAELIPDAEYRFRYVALDDKIASLRKQLRQNSFDFERIIENALGMLREVADSELKTQKRILGTLIKRLETADGHLTKIEPREWARPI